MRKPNIHARALRRNMTDAERRLWHQLRGRRFRGWKFRRQATVGRYIADFLCIEARLAVEIDGGQHSPEIDRRRTAFLEAQDLKVLRFWNAEVLENMPGVLWTIDQALCAGTAYPSPAGGRRSG